MKTQMKTLWREFGVSGLSGHHPAAATGSQAQHVMALILCRPWSWGSVSAVHGSSWVLMGPHGSVSAVHGPGVGLLFEADKPRRPCLRKRHMTNSTRHIV